MEKHLHYYTQHSQYVEPTDKPAVSYCEQENEVHYHPASTFPLDEHEYVDLGLPSGTLWAKCNVGANSETDYGLRFAWGETEGYTDTSLMNCPDWSNYKYGTSSTNLTKYNTTDRKRVLDAEDDAVRVSWGGQWHMPTKEQFQELLNTTYVTKTWVTNYQGSGINGGLFTSTRNGNTIFIPAEGFCKDGEVYEIGYNSGIWSSSLNTNSVNLAQQFHLSNAEASVLNNSRYVGLSVRGVIGIYEEEQEEQEE